MSKPLFVFGTLCHAPLRAVVLGDDTGVHATPAELPGYASYWVEGRDHPMLVEDATGSAAGVLLDGLTDLHMDRLAFFEAGFDYGFEEADVLAAQTARMARRFASGPSATPGAPWSLEDWADQFGAIWVTAAQEIMSYFGEIDTQTLASRMHMIHTRAASRVRAAQTGPATLRAQAVVSEDVVVEAARRPYSNYFTLEEHDLRFRRFDGEMSAPVNRAGFVGGDAVTVLPYDPERDLVLLVEQFRVGPYLRGDTNPWSLEPIAGRIDAGETPERTARREAEEEAQLTLGALHYVSGHYPSPGAVTEYVYAFVAEADLSDQHGYIGGLDAEDENIRSHVIAFDRLLELIKTDEAGNGPLIVSAFWLALNRDRLRARA